MKKSHISKENEYTKFDDEHLLNLFKQDDKKAFAALFMKYHKLLYITAYRFLKQKENAEDVVQQIFIRLWDYRSNIPENINMRNYLYTMIKNSILNQMRSNNNVLFENYERAQNHLGDEKDFFQEIEKKELDLILKRAINLLPPHKKKITLYKIYGKFSNQEIAEKMNINLSTVKCHYNQSIKLLRYYMSKMLVVVVFILLLKLLLFK